MHQLLNSPYNNIMLSNHSKRSYIYQIKLNHEENVKLTLISNPRQEDQFTKTKQHQLARH